MNDESTNTDRTKVAHHSWWICGLLGLIIGLSSSNDKGMMVFIGVSNGLFWGWILGLIIDKVRESTTLKTIEDKIEEFKENQSVVEQTKISLAEYSDAKNRFQYLSNETLTEKFKSYVDQDKSDMTRLALEEELVRRGILDHSPMHEKLDKIKSKFS